MKSLQSMEMEVELKPFEMDETPTAPEQRRLRASGYASAPSNQ